MESERYGRPTLSKHPRHVDRYIGTVGVFNKLDRVNVADSADARRYHRQTSRPHAVRTDSFSRDEKRWLSVTVARTLSSNVERHQTSQTQTEAAL